MSTDQTPGDQETKQKPECNYYNDSNYPCSEEVIVRTEGRYLCNVHYNFPPATPAASGEAMEAHQRGVEALEAGDFQTLEELEQTITSVPPAEGRLLTAQEVYKSCGIHPNYKPMGLDVQWEKVLTAQDAKTAAHMQEIIDEKQTLLVAYHGEITILRNALGTEIERDVYKERDAAQQQAKQLAEALEKLLDAGARRSGR